jgi:hypothetical protein
VNVDDLKRRFKHHPPKDDAQIELYATVRNELLNVAIRLDELTGGLDSREKSLAVTHLEEAMFWFNGHIARSGGTSGPTPEHLLEFQSAPES